MSFSLFIISFLLAPDLLFWWWADRRLRGRAPLRVVLALFVLLMAVQPFTMAFLRPYALRSHEWLPTPYIAAAYLWHLLALPLWGIAAGLTGIAKLVRRRRPKAGTDPSRRRLLMACAAFAPPVATGVGVAVALPSLDEFRVRRLRIGLEQLPARLDGMTIAHVSDVHYGKFTESGAIGRVAAAIDGLEADLVLLTGDLIDLSLRDLPAAIEFVSSLDRRQGLFLCEGNHDLIDDPQGFRERVRAAGLPLLLDESARVDVNGEAVDLLGAAWRRTDDERRRATGALVGRRAARAFPILLAHHPHHFDHAEGVPLTLSGHTHGGLLMWNERLGAGPVLYRYWSGLYRRAGRALVVSNGIGNWFPVRAHAPAEIVHVTLEKV